MKSAQVLMYIPFANNLISLPLRGQYKWTLETGAVTTINQFTTD